MSNEEINSLITNYINSEKFHDLKEKSRKENSWINHVISILNNSKNNERTNILILCSNIKCAIQRIENFFNIYNPSSSDSSILNLLKKDIYEKKYLGIRQIETSKIMLKANSWFDDINESARGVQIDYVFIFDFKFKEEKLKQKLYISKFTQPSFRRYATFFYNCDLDVEELETELRFLNNN